MRVRVLAAAAVAGILVSCGDPETTPTQAHSHSAAVAATQGQDLDGLPDLIVDEKATPEQREALKSFAQEMGGELLKDVVRTEAAPISLALEFSGEHPSGGKLQAGELATISRVIAESDANVTGVDHTRIGGSLSMGDVAITIDMETKGHLHSEQVLDNLRAEGFQPVVITT